MKNIDKVRELFNKGLTNKQISEKLKMAPSNVCIYLNKAFGENRPKYIRISERKRRYTLNEHYFDKIDTEDKAYFLGLLYSDGCMASNTNVIQIALQEEDVQILEKFRECINSNKPLGFIKSSKIKGFKNLNKEYYRKNQNILVICSSNLKNSLISLGLTSNKSLSIKFPINNFEEYFHHFIRGYFDGDGGIYGYNKNKWEISIAGNEHFCKDLNSFIKSKNISSKCEKHHSNNVFYVRIAGRLNCIDFYNYVYKDSTIYLNRKYNKFQECIKSTKTTRYGNTWKKKDRIDN